MAAAPAGPRRRGKRAATLAVAGALASRAALGALAFTGVSAAPDPVERLDVFEVAFDLAGAAYTNPFDPAQIDVKATFVSPTGATHEALGFRMLDFARAGPPEVLTPGVWSWRVRFTPDEAGDWTYSLSASDAAAGDAAWGPGTFTCSASARRGYVRKSALDDRYLCYDDGQQFVFVGQNVSWAVGPDYTYSYDLWLPAMAAEGANYSRYWMCSWYHGIEWTDTPLGDYANRQDEAWRLDHDLELARAYGITVMLCLVNHGSVSTETNPEWSANPYFVLNGGPCWTTRDFFVDPTARILFMRRLRYIVARWGYAPNLIWELFNEVDLTNGYDSSAGVRADVAAWHAEMAAFIRSLDARHMITTSFCRPQYDPAVWHMADIGLTQFHCYSTSGAMEDIHRADVASYRASYPSKPVYGGEFGIPTWEQALADDPAGIHLHNSHWASLLGEAAGAPSTWWWDLYVDPCDLYGLFRGPATFAAAVDFQGSAFVFSKPPTDAALKVHALVGPERVAAWVLNPEYNYVRVRDWGTPSAVTGDVLHLAGLAPDGDWSVDWWDTFAGTVTASASVTVSGGAVDLALPDVAWDVALTMSFTGGAQPGLVIAQTSGATRVRENGFGDSYTIRLATAPAADVTVTATAPAGIAVSPASIAFTPGDWSAPKAVSVSAVDDAVPEPEEHAAVFHACSGDAAYAALSPVALDVLIVDDEDPEFLRPFGCGAPGGGAGPSAIALVAAASVAAAAGSRRRARKRKRPGDVPRAPVV